MAKINIRSEYNLKLREYHRPYIQNLLRSAKEQLEEDIELAKCDDDEDKVEQLEDNLWTVQDLLDQIDLQKEDFELEAEQQEDEE